MLMFLGCPMWQGLHLWEVTGDRLMDECTTAGDVLRVLGLE